MDSQHSFILFKKPHNQLQTRSISTEPHMEVSTSFDAAEAD